MKKALALVIGNGIYEDPDDNLDNAVNDAIAIEKKLHNLGFIVILKKNCTKVEFEKAIKEFEKKLEGFEVGLFYYSGHAFQIERENYLSATDSNFEDSDFAKTSCIPLQLIIKKMDRAKSDVKIIILDACRNNPLKERYRGGKEDLAPVKAPKGSLIAFSTSPGEKAQDFGKGGHSIYTGCLLKHLEDPDIPIEVLFKRVRVSVNSLSKGKQTPWEHTSMIEDFYFHRSELVHVTDLPYDSQSLIREQFVPKGSVADKLILDLFSTQFSEQNYAATKVRSLAKVTLSPSEKFLLGRGVLYAANYGGFKARDLINTLGNWIISFDEKGENHLLNGILFEIYFDEKGHLSKDYYKGEMLDEIYQYESDSKFEKSFKFLLEQLKPHRNYLFYLPGDGRITIDLLLKEYELSLAGGHKRKYFEIQSMKIGGSELFKPGQEDELFGSSLTSMSEFSKSIVKYLLIPKSKQNIITPFEDGEVKTLGLPPGFDIREIMKARGQ
ncbi:caspase family protein [Chryseobacterium sp. Marseille-Q8038]